MTDVSQMQAGRELDALVAEKVMRFEWRRGPLRDTNLKALLPPKPREFDWLDTDDATVRADDFARFVPHYSTDIRAAWEVVEKLPVTTVVVQRADSPDGKSRGYRCGIPDPLRRPINGHPGLMRALNVDADTAPLAICRAALKALGVGGPTVEQP